MKNYLLLLTLFLSTAAFAGDKGTWTGFISDAHCGAKGNSASHAACAKTCVKGGEAPVLVVGDKIYTISNPKKVSKYIGDKVTVTGTLTGDDIAVESVKK